MVIAANVMTHSASIAGLLSTLLTSCVLVPVNRTYYEPNPGDGVPSRSASCGYHRAAQDMLTQKVAGVTIAVLPRLQNQRLASVYVSIERTKDVVSLDPSRFALHDSQGRLLGRPIEHVSKDGGPYFLRGITYTFSEMDPQEEISILLLPGFIEVNGDQVKTQRFRFKKTTKLDVYYGSINCTWTPPVCQVLNS